MDYLELIVGGADAPRDGDILVISKLDGVRSGPLAADSLKQILRKTFGTTLEWLFLLELLPKHKFILPLIVLFLNDLKALSLYRHILIITNHLKTLRNGTEHPLTLFDLHGAGDATLTRMPVYVPHDRVPDGHIPQGYLCLLLIFGDFHLIYHRGLHELINAYKYDVYEFYVDCRVHE